MDDEYTILDGVFGVISGFLEATNDEAKEQSSCDTPYIDNHGHTVSFHRTADYLKGMRAMAHTIKELIEECKKEE